MTSALGIPFETCPDGSSITWANGANGLEWGSVTNTTSEKKILEKNWIRCTNQNGREKITPSSKSIAQFKGAVDLSGAVRGRGFRQHAGSCKKFLFGVQWRQSSSPGQLSASLCGLGGFGFFLDEPESMSMQMLNGNGRLVLPGHIQSLRVLQTSKRETRWIKSESRLYKNKFRNEWVS